VNDFTSAAAGARFVNIGERTNVTGSAKFKKLILAGDYDAAVTVARDQVEAGAQIIDVNMDEALLDGELAMATFLKRLAAEPDIARVPVMIDSSKWSVIEAGLKCVSGKPIVNSISLKEGEGLFLKAARRGAGLWRRCGGDGLRRNRAGRYQAAQGRHLRAGPTSCWSLTGFRPKTSSSIPMSFAVATGIDEHRRYAIDFIEAVREIRVRCPHVHVSGGPQQSQLLLSRQ
jgi:5-methyltetrahydrofolate--homocysteine methyltransferase